MDSKSVADAGLLCNKACDRLYGQKYDEKYALYIVTRYTSSLKLI